MHGQRGQHVDHTPHQHDSRGLPIDGTFHSANGVLGGCQRLASISRGNFHPGTLYHRVLCVNKKNCTSAVGRDQIWSPGPHAENGKEGRMVNAATSLQALRLTTAKPQSIFSGDRCLSVVLILPLERFQLGFHFGDCIHIARVGNLVLKFVGIILQIVELPFTGLIEMD